MTKRPISIYIHIPFCVKKCNYCDFLSAAYSADERSVYVMALISEIEADLYCDKYAVKSVFFGGGTPSLLSVDELDSILCKLHQKYEFDDDAEITLECNPGTVSRDYFWGLGKIGFNRISIGAQSFNDEELKVLGRIHRAIDIYDCVENVKSAGFVNFNLDLMSSLPNQTAGRIEETLDAAISLKPAHFSVYSLIIEPGTRFHKMQDELKLPDEDENEKIDELIKKKLSDNGYCQYEISNYAKKGFECIHNITYWKRGEYRGYGLGAASLLCFDGAESRFSAEEKMDNYLKDCTLIFENRKNAKERIILDNTQICEETVFLGLRMNEGICIDDFPGDFAGIYGKVIGFHEGAGLAEFYQKNGKEYYHLTARGMEVANLVMSEYLLSV